MHFRGHVVDLPLPKLLSILQEQARSCDIELSDDEGEGLLRVRTGRLVEAELNGLMGLAAFEAACGRDELIYDVVAPGGARPGPALAELPELEQLARKVYDESGRLRAMRSEPHGKRISYLALERARDSRFRGRLALGVALTLVAMVFALRPTGHASEHTPSSAQVR
ncbi:MAG: hypothetical protein RL385_4035 [Pseudomonadota bacterium]|jgi:hypothetical protein